MEFKKTCRQHLHLHPKLFAWQRNTKVRGQSAQMRQRRRLVSSGFKVCRRQAASVHSIMRVRRTVRSTLSRAEWQQTRECILLCGGVGADSEQTGFFIFGRAERKGWRKRWRKRRLQMRWLWRAPRTREPRERERARERDVLPAAYFPGGLAGRLFPLNSSRSFLPHLHPGEFPRRSD